MQLSIHALTAVATWEILAWMSNYKLMELCIDGLVQDCSNSSALAMELLQSFTKPSVYDMLLCIYTLLSHEPCYQNTPQEYGCGKLWLSEWWILVLKHDIFMWRPPLLIPKSVYYIARTWVMQTSLDSCRRISAKKSSKSASYEFWYLVLFFVVNIFRD